MDIDWESPSYWIVWALLVFVPVYLYSQYRKNKRIRLLKDLKFTVNTNLTSLHRRALTKLAPEIMTSEKLPFGSIVIGNDPQVWWHAKRKTSLCDFSVFKINKHHPDEGERGVSKEWIVASLTVKKSHFGDPEYYQLSKRIPAPDQYYLTDEGVYLVYRDLFFSTNKLKLLVSGVFDGF